MLNLKHEKSNVSTLNDRLLFEIKQKDDIVKEIERQYF